MTRIVTAPTTQLQTARPLVQLLGIGTATPLHIPQEQCAQYCEPLCCEDDQQRAFLKRIYQNSGVSHRGSVLLKENDPDLISVRSFFRPRASQEDRGPTTHERMQVYQQHAPVLAQQAAEGALNEAEIDAEEITHLITVTCTGFFAPGLDAELIQRLGLRPTVQRVQVGFMGCHGAFNALAAASDVVRATPAARVLVCCVELCSLHLAYGFDAQKLVANAIFADGAAAAVIGGAGARSMGPGASLLASSSMLIPGSDDAMTWGIGDHGFHMTLSPQVPQLVREHLRGWVSSWLDDTDRSIEELRLLAIHPGGPKVLTATCDALGADQALATPSREVLRDHGNMSSATVLFVLQKLVKEQASGLCLALGYGPGLMAEGMLLRLA